MDKSDNFMSISPSHELLLIKVINPPTPPKPQIPLSPCLHRCRIWRRSRSFGTFQESIMVQRRVSSVLLSPHEQPKSRVRTSAPFNMSPIAMN